jgi:hypothetical protein
MNRDIIASNIIRISNLCQTLPAVTIMSCSKYLNV